MTLSITDNAVDATRGEVYSVMSDQLDRHDLTIEYEGVILTEEDCHEFLEDFNHFGDQMFFIINTASATVEVYQNTDGSTYTFKQV